MFDGKNAQVGDKVKDPAIFGYFAGRIKSFDGNITYAMVVEFPEIDTTIAYTMDGRMVATSLSTLRYVHPDGSLSETRPEPKKVVDWEKVEARVKAGEDVKVLVRNNQDETSRRYYFSHIAGVLLGCFADGRSTWTSHGYFTFWRFCELAEPEKFQDCMVEEAI